MLFRYLCLTALAVSALAAVSVLADDVPAFRRDLLDPIDNAEKEILALAKAIPAEK